MGFDPDLTTGSYRQTDLDLVDAFTVQNALLEGPTVPGRVTFDVQWMATGPVTPMRNDDHGYAGDFRQSRATVAWSAATDTSEFVSAPAATSKSVFAFIGRERNGVFLP